MAEPAKPTPEIKSVSAESKLKKSENYSRIYSNGVQLSMSPWDIRMDFGQMLEGELNKVALVTDVTILMSPSHAAAFCKALLSTIGKYENAFGPINDPTVKARAAKAALEEAAQVAPKGIKKLTVKKTK